MIDIKSPAPSSRSSCVNYRSTNLSRDHHFKNCLVLRIDRNGDRFFFHFVDDPRDGTVKTK